MTTFRPPNVLLDKNGNVKICDFDDNLEVATKVKETKGDVLDKDGALRFMETEEFLEMQAEAEDFTLSGQFSRALSNVAAKGFSQGGSKL
ncbi:MAG: hypothetical protein M1816_000068 [Peltula sp. TS41687]|nr:MAG: hypothetical protein M1816_000068 [Peltula sp. TS41687]